MYTVVLAVIIQGSIKAGGLGQVWQTAYNNSRIEFFNFDPDPTVRHTFWTQLIGGLFNYVPLYASNQTQVSTGRFGCNSSVPRDPVFPYCPDPAIADRQER